MSKTALVLVCFYHCPRGPQGVDALETAVPASRGETTLGNSVGGKYFPGLFRVFYECASPFFCCSTCFRAIRTYVLQELEWSPLIPTKLFTEQIRTRILVYVYTWYVYNNKYDTRYTRDRSILRSLQILRSMSFDEILDLCFEFCGNMLYLGPFPSRNTTPACSVWTMFVFWGVTTACIHK